MHGYRKIASIPGTATLIRSAPSSVQLTGGRLGPVVMDQPRARSLAMGQLRGFVSSCLPGRSGAAAARQGSLCLYSVSIGSRN